MWSVFKSEFCRVYLITGKGPGCLLKTLTIPVNKWPIMGCRVREEVSKRLLKKLVLGV